MTVVLGVIGAAFGAVGGALPRSARG
jgi:hypothetical protein